MLNYILESAQAHTHIMQEILETKCVWNQYSGHSGILYTNYLCF